MTGEESILPRGWPVRDRLDHLARRQRIVFLAGLPGVGKSLLVQQLALLAAAAGRAVWLLQWDVARAAFETDDILARYPEIEGFTHAAIKRAVGLWARDAVLDWHRQHPEPTALLIIESALIGGRLSELVEFAADRSESLLASDAMVCLVPVPSREVRRRIERRREATIRAPTHPRERSDAAPNVLQALWEDLHRAGSGPDAPQTGSGAIPYDPAVYAEGFARMLTTRRTEFLAVDRILEPTGSVYQIDPSIEDLRASPEEIARIMARIDAQFEAKQ